MPKKIKKVTTPTVLMIGGGASGGSDHARLAPSAFKGYEICPSYIPNEEVTKAGERGTKLHRILEHKVAPTEIISDEDAEQLMLVEEYVKPFERSATENHLKILREHKFDLTKLKIEGCDRGTGDLLILVKKTDHVDLFDWKFGAWEVDDAEVNIQVGIYVLGTFDEFPWAKTVTARILQPARDEVSEHTFTRDNRDVTRILLRAKTIADQVNKHADVKFNPTVDNCLWCDRKADCPALRQLVIRVVDQAELILPEDLSLSSDSFDDLASSGQVYDLANVIERWAKSIKYKITQLAIDGHKVPDHIIRNVSGKRIVMDNVGCFKLLKKMFKVTQDEFMIGCNASITRLMEFVGKHAKDGEKGKKIKEASNALMSTGLLSATKPSAYLVRTKDKELE